MHLSERNLTIFLLTQLHFQSHSQNHKSAQKYTASWIILYKIQDRTLERWISINPSNPTSLDISFAALSSLIPSPRCHDQSFYSCLLLFFLPVCYSLVYRLTTGYYTLYLSTLRCNHFVLPRYFFTAYFIQVATVKLPVIIGDFQSVPRRCIHVSRLPRRCVQTITSNGY